MKRKIVVKADASVKPSRGSAVAYEAVIFDEDGRFEREENSRYIDKQLKTTRAETLAAAFAVIDIHKKYNGIIGGYELVIESDCRHTVREIGDVLEPDDIQRVIRNLSKDFNGIEARWISRDVNTRADAMAREKLRRGSEGY